MQLSRARLLCMPETGLPFFPAENRTKHSADDLAPDLAADGMGCVGHGAEDLCGFRSRFGRSPPRRHILFPALPLRGSLLQLLVSRLSVYRLFIVAEEP